MIRVVAAIIFVPREVVHSLGADMGKRVAMRRSMDISARKSPDNMAAV